MRIRPAVRALAVVEVLSLLRDPRAVFVALVLPMVLLPALFLAGSRMEDRRVEQTETRTYRVAVTGDEAAFALELLRSLPEVGESADRFRIESPEDPRRALAVDSLDAHVRAHSPDGRPGEDTGGVMDAGLPATDRGDRVLRIDHYATRTASREAAELLGDVLAERHEARRDSILSDAGVPVSVRGVATVESMDLATVGQVRGARLGGFLTAMILALMVLGGSAVATDSIAGEKERGTLATLLTTAASRTEIVTGKLLAVMLVAGAIAVMQLLNLWLLMEAGWLRPIEAVRISISPGLAGGLLLLQLPVVALVSGVLLLVSSHATGYREAQLYMMPVFLGLVVPALAPLLPDISLRSVWVAVPIANVALAARDLLAGDGHLAWATAAWFVTAGAAAWVVHRGVRTLGDEGLMAGEVPREEALGGKELFPRRVLRWILVLWAIKLVLELNLRFDDLRWTILLGVGVLFLAFPVAAIRRFRLDPVAALALRMPRPGAWAGVLIGVPAGMAAAAGMVSLIDLVLPVPDGLMESFGQAILQDELPLWQVLLLVALIPGVTEELTFRGVILHGLSKRLSPVALALAVGVIFGLFHYDPFRIPVTAFLGVILAATTLMTGSLYPAVVWHVLHNGLAVVLARSGFDAGELGWIGAAGGVVLLALALGIVWANRSPYPVRSPLVTTNSPGIRYPSPSR